MKIDLLEKKIVGPHSMNFQGYFAVGLVAFLSGYTRIWNYAPTLIWEIELILVFLLTLFFVKDTRSIRPPRKTRTIKTKKLDNVF
jgi:hypothetical protein